MSNGDPARRAADALSAPLEALLVSLGSGIGRSQAELDRHAIETQRRIDEDPILSQYGLSATWYQIPRTEMELKVAVTMDDVPVQGPQGTVTPAPFPGSPPTEYVAGAIVPPVPPIRLAPVNARYVNQFAYDIQAASTVKLQVVAVPPPGPVAAGAPRMTDDEVLAVARAATIDGQPVLFTEQGTGWRTALNFNAGLRAWFVVQTREAEDKIRLRALVKVDDDSGDVLKTVRET